MSLNECQGFTDVSALGRVHTLNLGFTDVHDVSNLVGVVDLDLSECRININSLITLSTRNKNLKSLTLNRIRGITDIILNTIVNNFTNLSELSLVECQEFTDVSILGKLHILDLSETLIDDVRALSRVHTLYLINCPNISDVSSLVNVRNLYLRDSDEINDVSMLGNLEELDIRGLPIEDEVIYELKRTVKNLIT